jgi:hypothetical protein
VGIDVLESLQKKAISIDSDLPVKYYILFSKSGFTDVLNALESESVILIQGV